MPRLLCQDRGCDSGVTIFPFTPEMRQPPPQAAPVPSGASPAEPDGPHASEAEGVRLEHQNSRKIRPRVLLLDPILSPQFSLIRIFRQTNLAGKFESKRSAGLMSGSLSPTRNLPMERLWQGSVRMEPQWTPNHGSTSCLPPPPLGSNSLVDDVRSSYHVKNSRRVA